MASSLGTVLLEEEVLAMMKKEIAKAQNIICLPPSTLRVLLDIFQWDSQALLDSYFSDETSTFEKANCVDPATIHPVDDEALKICNICLDDLDTTEIKHEACGHVFCTSCWFEYLKQSIVRDRKSLRLDCPMTTCSAMLDENFITNVCRKDKLILESYWSLLTNIYIGKKETLSKCPASHCTKTIELKDVRNCKVTCSCGQEFCFECSRANHYTVPCMLIEAWQANDFKEDVKFSFVIVMTKKCPNCKTDIEKDGGCPHIHCPRCKSDFCWQCLLPYKNHKQCKEEAVGDKREIEAVKNIGMTEQKRFQLFQKEFEKVKNNISKLILDKSAQSSLMSILPFTNDAQIRILLQKLPLRLTDMEQQENTKYALMETGNINDIVGALKSEMSRTTELGWFPTDHLSRAGKVLEEAQRVLMYSQVLLVILLKVFNIFSLRYLHSILAANQLFLSLSGNTEMRPCHAPYQQMIR